MTLRSRDIVIALIVVVSLLTYPYLQRAPLFSAEGFMTFLGHFGLLLLVSLAVGWVLAKVVTLITRERSTTGWWWLSLIVALPLSWLTIHGAATPYRYNPPGCELAATFPSRPLLQDLSGPNQVKLHEANLVTRDGTHFRAECFDFRSAFGGTGSRSAFEVNWQDWMHEFLRSEGIASPQVSVIHRPSSDNRILVVDGLGTKRIESEEVSFHIRLVTNSSSVLVLHTGGNNKNVAAPTAVAFLESYSLVHAVPD